MMVPVSPGCHAVLLDFRLQAFSCRYLLTIQLGRHPASWADKSQANLREKEVDGWTAPIIRSHFAHWLCAQG
jgi:hypothetical protein